MRKLLLTLLVAATLLLAGCTTDGTDGENSGGAAGEPTIAKGSSLGEWTDTIEGGPLAGAETIDQELDARCDASPAGVGSHDFTLPAADDNGVPWKASSFKITLTKPTEAPSELDLYLFDAEGNQLAANTESDLMGTNPFELTLNSLVPGDYTAQVHACSPTNGYTLTLAGTMVASQDVYSSE